MSQFDDHLESLLRSTGFDGTPVGDAIEDLVAPIERCPACGEFSDYCQGHGEIGDPVGFQILQQHDEDDHTSCNPIGCEEANNE